MHQKQVPSSGLDILLNKGFSTCLFTQNLPLSHAEETSGYRKANKNFLKEDQTHF